MACVPSKSHINPYVRKRHGQNGEEKKIGEEEVELRIVNFEVLMSREKRRR